MLLTEITRKMENEEISAANFKQTLEDIRQIDEVLESGDDDYDGSDLEIDESGETDDDLPGVPSIRPGAFSPKPLSTISSSLGDVPGSLAGLEVESDTDVDVSKEQLLFLNQQYQEYVATNLARVRKTLERNRELQQSKLNAKRKDTSSLVFTKFTAPYFKDDNRLNPPENEDSKAIRQLGYPMPTNPGCSRTWTKNDLENLKEGVKADGLERIMAPLLNQREVFEKRLKKARDDADKTSRKELIQEIREIDKELFNLKRLPEAEVLGGKDREVDWTKVAIRHLNGTRREWECQIKWQNEAHPSVRHDWESEDDQKLEKIAADFKCTDWGFIARKLGTGHTGFECLQRYQQKLNFNLFRRDYSPAEDNLITELVNKFRIGKFVPWMKVAYFLQDRKPCQIAWRWENKLDPTLRSGKWDGKEDELLKQVVTKQGDDVVWVKVALEIEGRTALQCRNRFKNCLSPHLRRGRFSALEDLILLEAIEKCGIGHWSKVSALLEKDERFSSGRSNAMYYHRYRYLANKQITKERAHYTEFRKIEKRKILEAEMSSIAGDSRKTLLGYSERQTFEDYLNDLNMSKFLGGMMKEAKEKVATLGGNAKTHNINEMSGVWYRCHDYKPSQTAPQVGDTVGDAARRAGDGDVMQLPSTTSEAPSVPLKVTRNHRSAVNYMDKDKWRPNAADVSLMTQLTKAVFPSTTLKPHVFFERNNKVMRGRNRSDIVMTAINTEMPVNWATAMSVLLMAVGVDFVVCRGVLYREARLPNISFLGSRNPKMGISVKGAKRHRKLAPAVGGARNNRPFKLVLDNPEKPGTGEMVTGSIIGHLPAPKKQNIPAAVPSKMGPVDSKALYVVKTEDGRLLLVSAHSSQQPGQAGQRTGQQNNRTADGTGISTGDAVWDQEPGDNIVITVEPVDPDVDDREGRSAGGSRERGARRREEIIPPGRLLAHNKLRRLALERLRQSQQAGDEGTSAKDASYLALLQDGSNRVAAQPDQPGTLTAPPVWRTSAESGLPAPTTVTPGLSSSSLNNGGTSDRIRIEKVNTLASCPDSIVHCTEPLVTTISNRELTQMQPAAGSTSFPRIGSGMIFKPKPKAKGPKLPRYCGDNAKIVVSVTKPNDYQAVVMYRPLLEREAAAERSLQGNEENNNVTKSVIEEGLGISTEGPVDASLREPEDSREAVSMTMDETNHASGTEPRECMDQVTEGSDEQAISLLMTCTEGITVGEDDDDDDARSSLEKDKPREGSEKVGTCPDGMQSGTDDDDNEDDIDGNGRCGSGKSPGRAKRARQNQNREDTDTGNADADGAVGMSENSHASHGDGNSSGKHDQRGKADGSDVNGKSGHSSNCDGGIACSNDEEGTLGDQNMPASRKGTEFKYNQSDTTNDPEAACSLSTKRSSRKRRKVNANYIPHKRRKDMPNRVRSSRIAAPKLGHFAELLTDDDDNPESESGMIGSSSQVTTSGPHSVALSNGQLAASLSHGNGLLQPILGGGDSGTPSNIVSRTTPASGGPVQMQRAQGIIPDTGQPGKVDINLGPNIKIILGSDGAVLGFLMDKPSDGSTVVQQSPNQPPSTAIQPRGPNAVGQTSTPMNPPGAAAPRARAPPSVKSLIAKLRAGRSSLGQHPLQQPVVYPPTPPNAPSMTMQSAAPGNNANLVVNATREFIQMANPLQSTFGQSAVGGPTSDGNVMTAPSLQSMAASCGSSHTTQLATGSARTQLHPMDSSPVADGSRQVAAPAMVLASSNPLQPQGLNPAPLGGTDPTSQGNLNPLLASNNYQQLTIILNPAGQPQGNIMLPTLGQPMNLPVLPSRRVVPGVELEQSPRDTSTNDGSSFTTTPGTPISVSRNEERSASSVNHPDVARLLNSPASRLGGPIMVDSDPELPPNAAVSGDIIQPPEMHEPPETPVSSTRHREHLSESAEMHEPPETPVSSTRHREHLSESSQQSPSRPAAPSKTALNLVARSPWRLIPPGKGPSTPKTLSVTMRTGSQQIRNHHEAVVPTLGTTSESSTASSLAASGEVRAPRGTVLSTPEPIPAPTIISPANTIDPAPGTGSQQIGNHHEAVLPTLGTTSESSTASSLAASGEVRAPRGTVLSTPGPIPAPTIILPANTMDPTPGTGSQQIGNHHEAVLPTLGTASESSTASSLAASGEVRAPRGTVLSTPGLIPAPTVILPANTIDPAPGTGSQQIGNHHEAVLPTLGTTSELSTASPFSASGEVRVLQGTGLSTPWPIPAPTIILPANTIDPAPGTGSQQIRNHHEAVLPTLGTTSELSTASSLSASGEVRVPQGTGLSTPWPIPAPTIILPTDTIDPAPGTGMSVNPPRTMVNDELPSMSSLPPSHNTYCDRIQDIPSVGSNEQRVTLDDPEALPSDFDGEDVDPGSLDRGDGRSDDAVFRKPPPMSSKSETVRGLLKGAKQKKPLPPELMMEDLYKVDLEKLQEFSSAILGTPHGQRKMGLLPPNLSTLFSFKHLLIRKDTLEESAEMFSLSRNQLATLTGKKKSFAAYKEENREQEKVSKEEFLSEVRKLPEYSLFKERFTFLYLWPAFLSLLQPYRKKPQRRYYMVPKKQLKKKHWKQARAEAAREAAADAVPSEDVGEGSGQGVSREGGAAGRTANKGNIVIVSEDEGEEGGEERLSGEAQAEQSLAEKMDTNEVPRNKDEITGGKGSYEGASTVGGATRETDVDNIGYTGGCGNSGEELSGAKTSGDDMDAQKTRAKLLRMRRGPVSTKVKRTSRIRLPPPPPTRRGTRKTPLRKMPGQGIPDTAGVNSLEK